MTRMLTVNADDYGIPSLVGERGHRSETYSGFLTPHAAPAR